MPRQVTNGPARQETNALSRLDYASFKIISDRNIFNANRSARSARAGGTPPPKPVNTESFSLVGTLSSEKGLVAFFDGTGSQYKKALKPAGTIAGHTIKEITTHIVKLEKGGKMTELRVGMGMRRQDEGEWQVIAEMGSYASVKPSATSNASAEASSSGEEDEVLKKLLQKREQELNK